MVNNQARTPGTYMKDIPFKRGGNNTSLLSIIHGNPVSVSTLVWMLGGCLNGWRGNIGIS